MDIIELIEKGVACWISERGRDQILSRIQSMQEVCDLTIKWKINPMIYYTQLIDAIDKLEALKND